MDRDWARGGVASERLAVSGLLASFVNLPADEVPLDHSLGAPSRDSEDYRRVRRPRRHCRGANPLKGRFTRAEDWYRST